MENLQGQAADRPQDQQGSATEEVRTRHGWAAGDGRPLPCSLPQQQGAACCRGAWHTLCAVCRRSRVLGVAPC